jgi:glycosyltransferase involved in cell wall biosynthesis
VLHTHELEQMFEGISEGDTETLVRYPRLVVACSEKARDVFRMLGRRGGLEVCYETINPARINPSPERSRELRRSLGAGDGTFVWVMAGTADPNKNPVRFIEVAAEVLRGGLDVRFIWIGKVEGGYGLYARGMVRELGMTERVSFIGERAGDYYDYFNAADGLVVTSLKESFSIVSVEAAYLGKPVVSFNCGGVAEIVRGGMGVVVDSWNTSDLVGAMRAVMRGEVGFDPGVSRERVREFYVDVQGERWENFMRRYFGHKESAGRGQSNPDEKV